MLSSDECQYDTLGSKTNRLSVASEAAGDDMASDSGVSDTTASDATVGSWESSSSTLAVSNTSCETTGWGTLDEADSPDLTPSSTSENFCIGPKDSLHRASVKYLRKMEHQLPSSDESRGPAWIGQVVDGRTRRTSMATLASMAASFRRKTCADEDGPNQYVLSVVYRGRCTHHLVARERFGAAFAINGRQTRCKSIESVVYMLALTQDAKWPVQLQHPVAPVEDPAEVMVEGRMLFSSNNMDAALHCYDKAIATVHRLSKMFPTNECEYEHQLSMAHELRSVVLLNRRRYSEAAEDAHTASDMAPEWWKPHFTRGLALRAGERFDDAVAAFQRAHNLLPIGDVKADQCTTAIRDTRALQAQAQQELSKKKLDDIESARKNSMAADQLPCKRPSFPFGPHMSDEGIWYILRKRELCDQRRASSCAAARHYRSRANAVVNTSMTDLCRELRQRTAAANARASGGDAQGLRDVGSLALEAPALPDVTKEAADLEKMFEQRLLPTGRWRVQQQQHVTTWMQWYHLRMGQKLPAFDLEQRHEQTTALYTWVLTTAHVLRNNVFCGDSPMGALTLHVVARKPIHEFTAVELCVMLPELTSVNVVQIIPSDRLHGELKCDDVLPGDDALPAQRLRVSTITGNYSELLEHDCKDVPTPDLVLFMDSGRQADPQIQADFEDAVDHLSKRRVPIIFTQRFRERHAEIKQWLRDMQVAVAQDTIGGNDLCSLKACSSDAAGNTTLEDKHEGQHNGYILFAPA